MSVTYDIRRMINLHREVDGEKPNETSDEEAAMVAAVARSYTGVVFGNGSSEVSTDSATDYVTDDESNPWLIGAASDDGQGAFTGLTPKVTAALGSGTGESSETPSISRNTERIDPATKQVLEGLTNEERAAEGVRNFEESENRRGGQTGFLDQHKDMEFGDRHKVPYSFEDDQGVGQGLGDGIPDAPPGEAEAGEDDPFAVVGKLKDLTDGTVGLEVTTEGPIVGADVLFSDPRGTETVPFMPEGPLYVQPGQGDIDRSGTSASYCDEESEDYEEPIYVGEGAPPSLLEEIAVLPEDFIFDQRGATSPAENLPVFIERQFNKNLMIPQQFYYDDYLSESYFFRDPAEQDDPRYNFGANVGDLKDHFRYSLGGTWDHTATEFNSPQTVYNSALNLDLEAERIPSLTSAKEARQNRGMMFHEVSMYLDIEEEDENDASRNFYLSGLELRADVSNLRRILSSMNRRQITNSDLSKALYDYLYFATSQTSEDPNALRVLGTGALTSGPTASSAIDKFGNPVTGAGTAKETLKRTVTMYSKNHNDHTFSAPVGYSKAYTDFYPPGARDDEVEILSHVPTDDLIIESPVSSLSGTQKKSFYRTLFNDYLSIFSEDLQLDPITGMTVDEDSCPADLIQKFPPEQIHIAKLMTSFLHDSMASSVERRDFVNSFYENFDSYNSISFKMKKRKFISSWLAQVDLYPMLFELIDNVYPSNSTFYAQVLDGWLNNSADYLSLADSAEGFQIESDLAAVNLRPNEIEAPFAYINRMLQGQTFLNRGEYNFEIEKYTYPLGFYNMRDATEGTTQEKIDLYFTPLYEKINTEIDVFATVPEESTFTDAINRFRVPLHRFAGNFWTRSAMALIEGQPGYSEVIAYRLEKTDAESGEVIQNFLFANTEELDDFTFLDTQVTSGRRYIYRIFTINFVVGTRYNYEMAKMEYQRKTIGGVEFVPFNEFIEPDSFVASDAQTQVVLRMPVSMRNDIRLIEAPYYEQEITTASSDFPPLYPDVSVAESYRTTETNLEPTLFMLTPQFGSLYEVPLALRDEDLRTIERMRENQQNSIPLISRLENRSFLNTREGLSSVTTQKINFRSDSIPLQYEMFYSYNRPRSYSDLYESNYKITRSGDPYFDMDIPLNTEIFVTFRARDAGGFSNPGPIYEFVKHNYGDGTYFSFEKLNLERPDATISFNRMITIEPAIMQNFINFEEETSTLGFSAQHSENLRTALTGLIDVLGTALGRDVGSVVSTLERERELSEGQTIELIDQFAEEIDPSAYAKAPKLAFVNLGQNLNPDFLIWDKNFKFRITSTTSGNSFDLNTSFAYNKILLEPDISIAAGTIECLREQDVLRQNRQRENRSHSNSTLNKVGSATYNETSTIVSWSDQDIQFSDGGFNRDVQDAFEEGGAFGRGADYDRAMDRAAAGLREYINRMS